MTNQSTTTFLDNFTTDAPYTYTISELSIILLIFGGIGFAAITANVIIAIAVILYSKFHTAGYALMTSLSAAETLALTSRVFLALPTSVLYQYGIYTSPAYLQGIGEVMLLGTYAQVSHIVCIAANRLCSVVLYHRYATIFSKWRTVTAITICWLYSLVWATPRMFGIATYHYYPGLLTWDAERNTVQYGYFVMAAGLFSIITIVATSCMYTYMVCRIKKINSSITAAPNADTDVKKLKKRKEELKLTTQFAIVTLVYIVTVAFSFCYLLFAPSNPSSQQRKNFNIFYNFLWIINYSVNPFIYLTFNKSMRRAFKDVVCCQSVQANRQTTVSTMNTGRSRSANGLPPVG